MNPPLWKEFAAVSLFLVAATWIIAASGADIAISSMFHINGSWPVGEKFPWKNLYRLDRIPAMSLASVGLLLCFSSLLRKKKECARAGIYLVLLLALGPGLLVNALFKEHWGRPRPRETAFFGGEKKFLQPWQTGTGKGRSFPSGHSSAAFYMAAPFFIYRRTRKRLALTWLAGGTTFGVLMSVARIAQGGHFLSDTLWGWGMVYLSAILLAAILKPECNSTPQTEPCLATSTG